MSQKELSTPASCMDDFDPDSLSAEAATHKILETITPIQGMEKVSLRTALDRVLAEDVHSDINVPSHINSAMDG